MSPRSAPGPKTGTASEGGPRATRAWGRRALGSESASWPRPRTQKFCVVGIKDIAMDLAIAAGQNDSLIEQLSFSLPAVATYARERRLVQVMPQGANTFAPNGNQVLTFNLTSQDGWLDPSSLRLHFRIRNTAVGAGADAAAIAQANALLGLTPASGCHCFFSQLRILIGGTEVEIGRAHV